MTKITDQIDTETETVNDQTYSMMDLLDQMGNTDPKLRMIIEFLNKKKSQTYNNQIEQAERLKILTEKSKKYKNLVIKLREENEFLKAECDFLAKKYEALASGLGACHRCWGEDAECDLCQGKGLSGYFFPDRKYFMELVLPAIKKMQKTAQANKNEKPHTAGVDFRDNKEKNNHKEDDHAIR